MRCVEGMIMGASASSVWYNLRVPHPCREVPILDYDLALLFQPMLMLGITLGVALSVVFPYWLITILTILLFSGNIISYHLSIKLHFSCIRLLQQLIPIKNIQVSVRTIDKSLLFIDLRL